MRRVLCSVLFAAFRAEYMGVIDTVKSMLDAESSKQATTTTTAITHRRSLIHAHRRYQTRWQCFQHSDTQQLAAEWWTFVH
jgi:hypothetical protein